MPKSVFGDQFGYDMQKDISGHMNDFYSGKISQSELEDFFKECCTSMRMYRTKQRQTSGNNLEDNKQIISEMYEMFAKENQRAARIANYNEGISVNEKYGGRKDDWAYYNSDYYYQCLDTKEILRNITEDIENKWGIPFINLEKIEANSKYTLDGGFDFNSGWNFSYRNQAGMASMEDESIEPPENFRFFYKEEYSFHQGTLSASLDGREYSVEVPFSASNQIYYINKLLNDFMQDDNNYKSYNRFLSNFAIFTRQYSFRSGINNIFGNYTIGKTDE